ncbi:Protein FAR1-RELATED SEQUENCE 5 [Glycine max]|nr:Protein FAR1-RELATED SEQUENCE 5 [Glycine max]
MVKLMCGSHNHELAKSLVGHPYADRLTKDEKTIIADMTKSMVKPRNILLTLKEHNVNSCTTIKQIYNARSVYRSSIRGSDTEMQHLILKDEDVICDIFWCHPDAVKLCNACNLVFLIDSTYKTNRYRLPLLDFVGVTPTRMTFSAGLAYLEGERLFLRRDALPGVIVTDKDPTLMNAVKTVFPDCTNLLCRFHIDKNVKAKCKSLIGQKKCMKFDDCRKKFEIACSPWPMFIDYVNKTWIIPHKEKFVKAWTNKVMHLGNTTINKYGNVHVIFIRVDEFIDFNYCICLLGFVYLKCRIEYAHWALKRLLQNNLGDLCSVWDAMNNMIRLQHTEIKASFEISIHVVGHVFKVTLYKRLLDMIVAEYERVDYVGKNPSRCGCVIRTYHGLPCACELSKLWKQSFPSLF